MDAPRVRVANVTVIPSRSGQVEGGGTCVWGEETTLSSAGDLPVVGWYSPNRVLLSQEPSYTLTPTGDTRIYALFEGDRFVDLRGDAWYLEDVMQAADLGIVSGVSEAFFEPLARWTGPCSHRAVQGGRRRRCLAGVSAL